MEYQETLDALKSFFSTDGRSRGHKAERQETFDSLVREMNQYMSAFQLRFLYDLISTKHEDSDGWLEERDRKLVRVYCKRSPFLIEEHPESKAWNKWFELTKTPRDVEAARIFQEAGIPCISLPWNPEALERAKTLAELGLPDLSQAWKESRETGPKTPRITRILQKYDRGDYTGAILQEN